ncbi:(R)-stereoselective amidase [Limihaloglobus sulfuriphilus]|uniref:(R)-stereoselective amidase n=1 Tax=Limihaloglobus sulfuriphilus TaxID=1851148 RepID=A0A1Q2MGX6_9BACT|nr:carbon-nitrogen hydrolase family protein [Limihaloglobus sulfuriphilus]AQQ71904.1 (R)-stereoselective amidase [Limihaloglobus sulfuriphilus]
MKVLTHGKVKIAACQFAVSGDIRQNSQKMQEYIRQAAEGGADIVHFSECCLSGYAGTDFRGWYEFDWKSLEMETRSISKAARKNRIYTVFGTATRAEGFENPFNSLVMFDRDGNAAGVYHKRFCTPTDIRYYTPGDEFFTFELNGVKFALLICYDLRFPELYRRLCRMGVEAVIQSFYNARQLKPSVHTDIMRQTMQCRAATNYMWVSMTNSSAPISPYPSCFIRPDGVIAAQLEFNKPGMMINTIDTSQKFYDASGPYRDLAIDGILTNRSMMPRNHI